MSKIRYGMIGTGNRGRSLIQAALATGDIEVVGLADTDPEALRQAAELAPNAVRYADYREMLARGGMDAVVIALPNHLHEQAIMEAMNAGVHVLCEKPIGPDLTSTDRILERVRNYSRIVSFGLELRHHPMFEEVRQSIVSGAIGNVRMLWCKEFRPRFRPGADQWRMDGNLSGGSILEKNCHHFDLFNWFADSRPEKVSAFGGGDVIYTKEGILDHAWVNVEYENGVKANLGLCLFQDRHDLELGVLGDKGTIVCTSPDEGIQYRIGDEVVHKRFGHLDDSIFDHGGEVEQHQAFIQAIRENRRPIDSLAAIRDSHLICIAAQDSIRTGVTIQLGL